MSGNNLLYVPDGIFSSMPNLKHLDLSNNSLVTLQDGVFANLSNLQTLDLRHNSLKHLKNTTLFEFSSHPGLSVLLGDNSWVCDCNIEPFFSWLKETTVVKNSSILVCVSPEKMRDTPVTALKIPELECPPYVTDTSLQTSYVFLGIVLALIGVIFFVGFIFEQKRY
ncbi:unnamed protein product [Staurois parvus]|uniref:LRRCT domain-containing protein n=1 Tax=Staurois parvus TaxID=386267 RepID=A0ABN9DLJ0_9NEOB|nr:unnamed protein product [Staurois parvus]